MLSRSATFGKFRFAQVGKFFELVPVQRRNNGWRIRLKQNGKVVGNPLIDTHQVPRVTTANWVPRPYGSAADSRSLVHLLELAMQRPVDYTERLLLSWYHTAIQEFTLQAGLAATSSALQLLGHLSETTPGENFRRVMTRLLASAQLQQSEPGPNRYSQKALDLATFVSARNDTAHPKAQSKFSSEWLGPYMLGLKWLELLLLHRLNYCGDFTDRFSFNVAPVPWSNS